MTKFGCGQVELVWCRTRRSWFVRAPGFLDFWCFLDPPGGRKLGRHFESSVLEEACRVWVERSLMPRDGERMVPSAGFRVVWLKPVYRLDLFGAS